MDITLKSGELARELALSQKIVSRKVTIPALTHVLLEPNGHGVRLTATDLDVGLRTTCAGTVSAMGSALLPARRLHDIVKLLAPDAVVRLKRLEGKGAVQVTADPYDSRLQALPVEDFPPVQSPNGQAPVLLPAQSLARMIDQVRVAVTEREDDRYFLSGAQLSLAQGVMTLAATDSHRLAMASAPRPQGADLCVLLPIKVIQELPALLTDADEVAFRMSENHLWFDAGDRQLVSRAVDGKFPNYERFIPRNTRKAVIDRDRLALAFRRVGLMASGEVRYVKFELSEGAAVVSAASAEVGDATDRVPAEYAGPPVAVKVAERYVLDFLDAADPGAISVELENEAKPMLLRQLSGAPATHVGVVMPAAM